MKCNQSPIVFNHLQENLYDYLLSNHSLINLPPLLNGNSKEIVETKIAKMFIEISCKIRYFVPLVLHHKSTSKSAYLGPTFSSRWMYNIEFSNLETLEVCINLSYTFIASTSYSNVLKGAAFRARLIPPIWQLSTTFDLFSYSCSESYNYVLTLIISSLEESLYIFGK